MADSANGDVSVLTSPPANPLERGRHIPRARLSAVGAPAPRSPYRSAGDLFPEVPSSKAHDLGKHFGSDDFDASPRHAAWPQDVTAKVEPEADPLPKSRKSRSSLGASPRARSWYNKQDDQPYRDGDGAGQTAASSPLPYAASACGAPRPWEVPVPPQQSPLRSPRPRGRGLDANGVIGHGTPPLMHRGLEDLVPLASPVVAHTAGSPARGDSGGAGRLSRPSTDGAEHSEASFRCHSPSSQPSSLFGGPHLEGSQFSGSEVDQVSVGGHPPFSGVATSANSASSRRSAASPRRGLYSAGASPLPSWVGGERGPRSERAMGGQDAGGRSRRALQEEVVGTGEGSWGLAHASPRRGGGASAAQQADGSEDLMMRGSQPESPQSSYEEGSGGEPRARSGSAPRASGADRELLREGTRYGGRVSPRSYDVEGRQRRGVPRDPYLRSQGLGEPMEPLPFSGREGVSGGGRAANPYREEHGLRSRMPCAGSDSGSERGRSSDVADGAMPSPQLPGLLAPRHERRQSSTDSRFQLLKVDTGKDKAALLAQYLREQVEASSDSGLVAPDGGPLADVDHGAGRRGAATSRMLRPEEGQGCCDDEEGRRSAATSEGSASRPGGLPEPPETQVWRGDEAGKQVQRGEAPPPSGGGVPAPIGPKKPSGGNTGRRRPFRSSSLQLPNRTATVALLSPSSTARASAPQDEPPPPPSSPLLSP